MAGAIQQWMYRSADRQLNNDIGKLAILGISQKNNLVILFVWVKTCFLNFCQLNMQSGDGLEYIRGKFGNVQVLCKFKNMCNLLIISTQNKGRVQHFCLGHGADQKQENFKRFAVENLHYYEKRFCQWCHHTLKDT